MDLVTTVKKEYLPIITAHQSLVIPRVPSLCSHEDGNILFLHVLWNRIATEDRESRQGARARVCNLKQQANCHSKIIIAPLYKCTKSECNPPDSSWHMVYHSSLHTYECTYTHATHMQSLSKHTIIILFYQCTNEQTKFYSSLPELIMCILYVPKNTLANARK